MLRSQTLRDLSSYLSLHISVCALASACCSFLPPPQPPVGSRTPPLAPHCPLHARTHTRAQAAGVITRAGPTDHSDALATASGPNNPVCSRPRSPVCAPGGVDEPYAPPPHPPLPECRCFGRRPDGPINRDRSQVSRTGVQPAALRLTQANRECKTQAGALFSLSEPGMNNSGACHNTPPAMFHIFTALP